MTAAHDLPPAIQWHEGMLLAPQHFQQATRRSEALLAYHTSLTAPFYWGVRHLRIDPIQLVDGTFRVLELEGVLPDGLVVSHLGDKPAALSLDLTPHTEEMRRRECTVHLAVTAALGGLPAVSGELARYDSVSGQPVTDVNTGDGELRIPRLEPRLRLRLEDEVPKKFVSIPLARLRYRDETFTLTRYVPPSLRVPLGSPLGEVCAAVAKRLREKAAFLSDQARSPEMAARVPQLLATRQQVHSLVAALPPFEAVLHTGASHPFPLYLALCSLVGHLAAVGHALVPPVLEPYDHNDPYAGFSRAKDNIFQVLEEGISEAYTAYRLDEVGEVFRTVFEEPWMDRKLILGARRAEGATEAGTVAWMENSLIGAESKMSTLRLKRIRGAEHKRFEGEGELVPASGVVLFSLAADPRYVLGGEALEIINLDDPGRSERPVEIILYVRND